MAMPLGRAKLGSATGPGAETSGPGGAPGAPAGQGAGGRLGPLWAMGEGFAPGPEQRMALYRGKVVALRESAEWYRFFVGDIVKRWLGLKASLPWPGRWARMRRTA